MTEANRRKRLIKEGEAAFRAEVEGWMPKPKVLKIGDRVKLVGSHPWKGETGTVARFEEMALFRREGPQPVVKLDLDYDQECFITQADQWRKV